ncbi:MAG TPA: hypothetical protein VNW99_04585 [Cytophagaceae bacterium]|nr:hypothetical protein [Cytophagaceae bacterium]
MKNHEMIISNQFYPLFRKRPDGKTYYKIISGSELEELKIFGKKYTILHTKAIKYPEKLYISELIDAGNSIECLDNQQYSEILKFCQSQLKKV